MPKPLLFAHRGASALLPENTLEAFSVSMRQGATALELDVQCTRDDVIVVFHDDNGRRMTGVNKLISAFEYSDIKKWQVGQHSPALRIPTLEEFLEAFPLVLKNIDIKSRPLWVVDLVVKIIRRHKATETVVLTSSNNRSVDRIRELDYEGAIGSSYLDVAMALCLSKNQLRSRRRAGDRVQVPTSFGLLRFDRPTFIRKCHYADLLIDFWVINDAIEAKRLLALGADGIMTDNPSLLQPLFEAIQ